MTFNRLGLEALTLCLGLTAGCSSVLTATRDNPIEDDRGTRTFGSKIDDSLIETKVAVNVAKANPADAGHLHPPFPTEAQTGGLSHAQVNKDGHARTARLLHTVAF